MDNQVSHQLNISFLLKWILVTSIAYIFGFMFSFALSYVIDDYLHPPDYRIVLFMVSFTMAIVGYSQWLILRKYLPVNSFWGAAYLIGSGMLLIVVVILIVLGIADAVFNSFFFMNNNKFITVFTLISLLAGFLQLHLLKPFSIKKGWWLAGISISWIVTSIIIFLINIQNSLVALVFNAILMGAISGICLMLIAKPKIYFEKIMQ